MTERLIEKIVNKETGEVLLYRLKGQWGEIGDNRMRATKKLGELEDAEEDGRLVVLPCKVGDTVYLPNKYVGIIITFNIVEFCMFKDEYAIIDDSDNEYKIEDFGKTVFLTREEAEKALKEMEGKQSE